MKKNTKILLVTTAGILAFLAIAKSQAQPKNDIPRVLVHTSVKDVTDDLLNIFKENNLPAIGRIYAQWPEIEPNDGDFSFILSTFKPAFDKIEQADLWCAGYLPTRYMPQWFMDKFPDCYLISGNPDTTKNKFTYILSPWFVATGQADDYLKRYFDAMIDEFTKHRNINTVFLEWMIFQLYTQEDYFRCFDPYAIASYQNTFNTTASPPHDYTEYLNYKNNDSTFADRFDKWYKNASIRTADKYLSWIGDRIKYKVVFINHTSSDFQNIVKGFTEYQVKSAFDIMSKYNNVIEDYERFCANDLVAINHLKNWTKERNVLYGGEPACIIDDINYIIKSVDEFLSVNADSYFFIGTLSRDRPDTIEQLKRIINAYPKTTPPSEYF